jgi:hypothetical protein
VSAAQAAEPIGASTTAGLYVRWFGAGAERDSDLADGKALVFAFQQHPCLAPHVVAAGVELDSGKGIHGLARPGGGD